VSDVDDEIERQLDELRDQTSCHARAITALAGVVDGQTATLERLLGPDGIVTAVFDQLRVRLEAVEAKLARVEELVQSPQLKRF
jgi:hypothetical protein